MKVVLIDEVPSLGIPGDVKEVKDGYARNYLIPQKLAVLATSQELARAESRKKVELERRAKLNKEINEILAEPAIKARLTDLGGEPLIGTPEAFGAMIAAETAKWKKVIEEAKVQKVQ